MANLIICEPQDLADDHVLIRMDARKCQTQRDFYETLAEKLHFPDYFAFNLDSLDEMLNDLSWIEDRNLALYFDHTEHFLINERNENKVLAILDLLDAICEDWKWYEEDTEGLEEDEEPIPKKSLVVGFEKGTRIDLLFNNLVNR
jgi:RNAse (barnase) inhibitor barstar